MIPSNVIISRLILLLGNSFLETDFMQIINYLRHNQVRIGNQIVDPNVLDYTSLYYNYVNIMNVERLNTLRNVKSNMIPQAEAILTRHLQERKTLR